MRRNRMTMLTTLTTGMIAGIGLASYVSSNKELKKPVRKMKNAVEKAAKEAVNEIQDMTMKN